MELVDMDRMNVMGRRGAKGEREENSVAGGGGSI